MSPDLREKSGSVLGGSFWASVRRADREDRAVLHTVWYLWGRTQTRLRPDYAPADPTRVYGKGRAERMRRRCGAGYLEPPGHDRFDGDSGGIRVGGAAPAQVWNRRSAPGSSNLPARTCMCPTGRLLLGVSLGRQGPGAGSVPGRPTFVGPSRIRPARLRKPSYGSGTRRGTGLPHVYAVPAGFSALWRFFAPFRWLRAPPAFQTSLRPTPAGPRWRYCGADLRPAAAPVVAPGPFKLDTICKPALDDRGCDHYGHVDLGELTRLHPLQLGQLVLVVRPLLVWFYLCSKYRLPSLTMVASQMSEEH